MSEPQLPRGEGGETLNVGDRIIGHGFVTGVRYPIGICQGRIVNIKTEGMPAPLPNHPPSESTQVDESGSSEPSTALVIEQGPTAKEAAAWLRTLSPQGVAYIEAEARAASAQAVAPGLDLERCSNCDHAKRDHYFGDALCSEHKAMHTPCTRIALAESQRCRCHKYRQDFAAAYADASASNAEADR